MITVFSTASEIGAGIGSGTITSRAVCQMYLDRITAKNPAINAITAQRTAAAILADADTADARAATGSRLSPLDGVPFTLKMPLGTQGLRTANSSGSINVSPAANGDIAAKLKAAGCVLLGKSNGPGALPSRTRTFLGETKNPRNVAYATGGSSGGSAAVVAAGLTAFDIGVDSAGSIRIPASFCGVYGLKTTNGSVSGHGDWSIMPSQPPCHMLDVYSYGPLARSLNDVAAIYSIIAGPTLMRPNCPPLIPCSNPTLRKAVSVRTIGPWYCSGFVQNAVDAVLAQSGLTVTQANLGWFDETAFNNCYAGLSSDPATFSAQFPPSESPWYAAQLNYAPLSSRNAQATAHALWLSEVLASTMGDADVLVMGTVALSPPPITGADPASIAYMAFTGLFNITGNPAITLPLGTDPATGVSFGLQLVGRHWRDLDLISLASQITGLPGYQPPTF